MVSCEVRLLRSVRASCSTFTKDIQSNQILGVFEESSDITVELDAFDHFIAVPSVLVHPDLRFAWDATFWRTV